MKKSTVQPQDKYVLRLPDGMRERIRAAAEENNRSMNAEILARLEETFDGSEELWDEVNRIAEAVEAIQRDVSEMAPRVAALWERPYDGSDN